MSPNVDFAPESAVERGLISFKLIVTFFNNPFERTGSPSKPVAKRAKHDGGGSTASERSSRVRFRLCLLYQFLICSRIALTIARASRWDSFIETKDVLSVWQLGSRKSTNTVYRHHFSHLPVFALLPWPHLIVSQYNYIQMLYPIYRYCKWFFPELQAGVESTVYVTIGHTQLWQSHHFSHSWEPYI